MQRFPIVSMALWLFVLGAGAVLLLGWNQMRGDFSPRALPGESAATMTAAPPVDLPQFGAINFDPVRPSPAAAARAETVAAENEADAAPAISLVVNASSLNVRSQPNSRSPKVATLAQGEGVDVLAEEGKWSQIRTADGLTGWAFSQYLAPRR